MNKVARLILAQCFQGQSKRGVETASNHLLERLNFPFHTMTVNSHAFSDIDIGCVCVSQYVKRSLSANEVPITIGGDHTVSAGSVQGAVDKYGSNLHVLWIDAHADINTPATSTTGNIHGMPVASLLGLMPPLVTQKRHSLQPDQITYLGLRDVDKKEEDIIRDNNIANYRMSDVESGIGRIMKEIEEKIEGKKLHVSVDIDVLDPKEAPSTGTPVKGGLSVCQLNNIINKLSKNIVSFDLTEVNPELGTERERDKTLDSAASILNTFML